MRSQRKSLLILSGLLIILSAYFVAAAHVVTPTSITAKEDVSTFYNITLNNSNVGQAANITQLNITLPSGIVPTLSTNGTSAIGVFTNYSSNTLTWTNTTGYLINGSTIKSFWFNATAATPGNYTIAVTVTNSSGSFSSNVSVIVNDTNVPTITLLSPADATSSTTTSYNFTFNLTDSDGLGAASCRLLIDNSVRATSTAVNSTGGTNGIYYEFTLETGFNWYGNNTYTWNINCTDFNGNAANATARTVTVLTTATTATTTPSGGSSKSASQTYSPTKNQMTEGYKLQMSKGTIIKFEVESEKHSLKVDSVSSDVAEFTISSNTISDTLSVGETKEYDVDGDGSYYDLRVKLVDITKNKANFEFTSINNQIAPAATTPSQAAPQANEEPSQTQTSPQIESESSSMGGMIAIGIGIVIVIVIVVIATSKKNKKSKSH